MTDRRFRFIKWIVLLILTQSLFSLEWRIDPTPSSVLLPEGWVIYDRSEAGRVSFINPEQTMIFQISVYPGETYSSDREMMNSHLGELFQLTRMFPVTSFRGGLSLFQTASSVHLKAGTGDGSSLLTGRIMTTI